MNNRYDYIIIGAGLAGTVVARELAEQGGKHVLILERRNHIGGNAYDYYNEDGILIHKYGPHIFHTNNHRVYEYLSRFTNWFDYQHRVTANIYGELMPVPFNLTSLELAFGKEKAAVLEKKLLNSYKDQEKVTILQLRENPDSDIATIADYIYENIFIHYTMKQWGKTPEEIDPQTTARVPILLSRDDRYFQDIYLGMPEDGYTSLFQRLIDHPNMTLELKTEAKIRLTLEEGKSYLDNELFEGTIIYTGAIDELFDLCYGRLPYRTLDFQFKTLSKEWFQTHGTVNYTVNEPYTRITEFKHLTGQNKPECTTIVREYSYAYTGAEGETPYYAIINQENNALYNKYKDLAEVYPNLFLLGRLAEYKYYNMDQIVAKALELSDTLVTNTNITKE